ncbi:MAG: DNA polymerase IV [Gemmatimonadota bacterium]|jgi:DNA polymerase-4
MVAEREHPPRILLVDCDCFFVQVARLEDPEGAGRARLLLVGGSASGRGVVTSASYEARAYGVRSAMPTAHALRLCPDAVVVGVPRRACGSKSRAILSVLEELSPVVQAASIDEFYLDLSGTERLLRDETLEETAARIRRTVLDRTDVSVSVGGGTNRTVAKLATRRAKPGGVFVVPPGREGAFLAEHRLADLPGVGPALLAALKARGLETVQDALPVQREWLERWFGESRGRWLHDRVRGLDTTPVVDRDRRKSVSTERTFHEDLHEDAALERELLRLAGSVAHALRSRRLRARTVTVKLRDPDFTTRQAGHTLPEAVESDAAVYATARGLLDELRARRRRPVRLLGIALSGLEDAEAPRQLGLFEEAGRTETERDRAISRVVDHLRDRFGDDAIAPGRILEDP